MAGRRWRWTTVLGGTLLAVGLCLPAPARANVGRDWRAGDRVGEPSGAGGAVSVVWEALSFDLRPVAAGRPARVVASYRLRAAQATGPMRLVFVSPGVAAGAVRLDGALLPSKPLGPIPWPTGWSAPPMPGVDGEPVRFEAEEATVEGLAFEVSFTPGVHVLTVDAAVRPGEHHGRRSPNREYVLSYLLAPARDWASFGELELTVELPAGWKHAASLPMDRLGDRLVGRWVGLPADHVGVAVRPPGEAGPLTTSAPWIGAFASAFVAWLVGAWWGRRAARRGDRTGKRWLKVIGMSYLAAVFVIAFTAAAAFGGSALLDEAHRSFVWGTAYLYEAIFAVAAGLGAALLGFFAAFVWTYRAAARGAGAVLVEARREGRT